jgi:hypothetical protein
MSLLDPGVEESEINTAIHRPGRRMTAQPIRKILFQRKPESFENYGSEIPPPNDFTIPVDQELEKIKSITDVLSSSIKNEIKHFKTVNKLYLKQNKCLLEIIKKNLNSLEDFKSTKELGLMPTSNTIDEIKTRKESFASKESKENCEEVPDCNLSSGKAYSDMLKELQQKAFLMDEIISFNNMIIKLKEKENFELKQTIDKINQIKEDPVQSTQNTVYCNACFIF